MNVDNLRLSPNGRTVLYWVHAHARCELFTSNVGGSQPKQVLAIPYERIRQLAWSPDGNEIAFTAEQWHTQLEPAHLFIASAVSGSPRRLAEQFDDIDRVDWSRDGQALYFSSREKEGIWKLNVTNNQLTEVATISQQLMEVFAESYIYRRLHGVPFSLVRTPLAGGPEERLFDDAFNFAIGRNDIYFVHRDANPPELKGVNLYRFDLSTRSSKFITHLGFAVEALQLSPDQRYLYAERHEPPRRHIMLVQNGR